MNRMEEAIGLLVRITKATLRLDGAYFHRDTRGLIEKFAAWALVRHRLVFLLVLLAMVSWLIPIFAGPALVLSLLLASIGMLQGVQYPLRSPVDVQEPNSSRYNHSRGVFFLGTEDQTSKEVWLSNEDCRTHFLVLGSCGSGKTETLLGFDANALTWNSGLLHCDGTGDVALFAKIYAMARRCGREDDVLVLNFMTGSGNCGQVSNTFNPFATGAPDSLTKMIVSFMDDAGVDGAMWKSRATAMITGVMRALVWLRDNQNATLNVGVVRDHLNLKMIIDLANKKKNPNIPEHVRKSLNSYLTSLPGYQEEKEYKQCQTTLDQHGYLEMQFTRIMGNLADVYGHIFAAPYGEVDMNDVVLNRRLLVIMLPALEKEERELANLGKIVVATLKGMMGATLGVEIKGNFEDVVNKRGVNCSHSPFLVILDEVGDYVVSGMGMMAAMARSLGFSMVYGARDLSSMTRCDKKEAQSIIANTNTKIFMRMEEPAMMTAAAKLAGSSRRATSGNSSGQSNGCGEPDVRMDDVDRVNLADLAELGPGRMVVLHRDQVIRAEGFYADPTKSLDVSKLSLRANDFISVNRPKSEQVERYLERERQWLALSSGAETTFSEHK